MLLVRFGMGGAEEVLLAGGSAGGLAVFTGAAGLTPQEEEAFYDRLPGTDLGANTLGEPVVRPHTHVGG